MSRCQHGIGSFLLCDDSDGISIGGQGIVTIVIDNSRQMQRALLAGSFKIVEDAVLVLEQGFLRIEQSGQAVCRLDLNFCSGGKKREQLRCRSVE